MTPTHTHAVNVLTRFYAAEAEYMKAGGSAAGATFDALAETLAADDVLRHSPDLPWGGDWHGHAGFEGWATRMSELNEAVEAQNPHLYPDGDTVLASLTLATRARTTGTVVRAPMVQLVRVKGEIIAEFRAFYWNVPQYRGAYDLPTR